jgi:hypothetical protein
LSTVTAVPLATETVSADVGTGLPPHVVVADQGPVTVLVRAAARKGDSIAMSAKKTIKLFFI